MDDIKSIFEKQRANRWNVARTGARERIAKLKKLKTAIWDQREQIQKAIYDDFRKNPAESDVTELFPVISEINHMMSHLHEWMEPVRVGTPLALFGTSSEVRLESKGLVLILSPWNYPFHLSVNPVATAIAAGNCVVLKPSSKVPNTARYLKKFFGGIFDESEVAVLEGSSKVSDALLELPFDHVFFTGSPPVGKKVMIAAAQHLASVTLELGGKSPVILDESADVQKAAERITWAKLINAGQTCVAPDYLLIHESKVRAFVDHARNVIAARFGKEGSDHQKSPDFCRLVSVDHSQKLKDVLEQTLSRGAKVELGGAVSVSERFLAPTILSGVLPEHPIMKEEIFGPILPMIAFKSLDEALKIIQTKDKPLALYIFSRDDKNIERILSNTTAGGTCINSLVVHLANPDLPFGGVGGSGMGNYHGYFGFRSLSHERAVLRQGPIDVLKLFYPPYTPRVKKLIQVAMKYLA